MKPLTIVVSFDVGEQVVPDGIPGWVASQHRGNDRTPVNGGDKMCQMAARYYTSRVERKGL